MKTKENWVYDEETRQRLADYIEVNELTQASISKKLGFSPTRLNKYLNLNKPDSIPEPDAERVEKAAKNFLRHLSRRSALKQSLFETSVSNDVATVLRMIRRTGDVGLIHGPAGVGKTCGAEIFCQDNPNTIFITATRYNRNAASIEQMIAVEVGSDAKPHGLRRSIWLEQMFKGSERLLIVDNAHKLSYSALEWLFDFHDATLCPIGLIGNPEVEYILRRSDQMFSRIGIKVKIFPKEDQKIARSLIHQIIPDAEGELLDVATDVISELGSCRTLKKQLVLARDVHDNSRTDIKWADAFSNAGGMLIKQRN